MPGYPRHHRHPKDLRKRDGTVRAVRLGGCLSTVVGFLAVVLVAAAGGWVVIRLLQAPIVEPVPCSPEDGVRAQQKIVGLVRRSTRAGSVVLSEAELNAFVSRHLDPADLPLREPAIRLRGDDLVNIVGTVSLGRLLNESPLAAFAEALPAGWLARPIWLTVGARGRISTEPRRAGARAGVVRSPDRVPRRARSPPRWPASRRGRRGCAGRARREDPRGRTSPPDAEGRARWRPQALRSCPGAGGPSP